MKKFLFVLIGIIAICCFLASCAAEAQGAEGNIPLTDAQKTMVEQSVLTFQNGWKEYIQEYREEEDSTFKLNIKNTRVVKIKENDIEYFKDIAYVVEFLYYINYYDPSDPYSIPNGIYDTVVVYKDGRQEIKSRMIMSYVNSTYNFDTSAYIEEILDLGSAYNRTLRLS